MMFKARRAAPVGAKHKWADGIYVKGNDHKWHHDKLDELSVVALKKRKNQHKDKELLEEFQDSAKDYVQFLADNNLNPKSDQNSNKFHKFWAEHFESEDWNEDDGQWKWAQALHEAAKNYHKHLQDTGKKEKFDEERYEREAKTAEQKKAVKDKIAAKKLGNRGGPIFTNPIHLADARHLIGRRRGTTSQIMSQYDGKEIASLNDAKNLLGWSVLMDGIPGVVQNYRYYSDRNLRRMPPGQKQVTELVLLTDDGKERISTSHKIKILDDPFLESEEEPETKVKGMSDVGIKGIVFDTDIGSYEQGEWVRSLGDAFTELGKKLKIDLNDKVSIHVYGKGGPGRGALADYSNEKKLIRLSTQKNGSSEALAHEIGHAVDDKLSGWHGTGSSHIHEIVRAYRETPQGKMEAMRLANEKNAGIATDPYAGFFGRRRRRRVSSYTNWMNKPEEIFARCFETYVATKVPSWEKQGWAKKPIDKESFDKVKPLFDKLFKSKEFKKAMFMVLRSWVGGEHENGL